MVQIEVEPARAAAAAGAAADLAGLLRQAAGRMEAASPADSSAYDGARTLAAWTTVWVMLRPSLLDLATRGEALSTASRKAEARFSEIEADVVPDVH